ncbi:MAG TPA: hypothetical protein VJ820_15750 [Propionibacteriaceae bacterium]|nr:hypothetical protein [Propionibacteriaceae bacterium]
MKHRPDDRGITLCGGYVPTPVAPDAARKEYTPTSDVTVLPPLDCCSYGVQLICDAISASNSTPSV